MSRTTLSTALLGYAPVIDDDKIIAGFRLHCIASAGREAPELGRMYGELLPHLKPESPGILLACGDEQVPETIDQVEADERLWVELNASYVATDAGEALLARLAEKGFCVVMRGSPLKPLPAALAAAVKMSLVSNEAAADTEVATKGNRLVPYSQGGVTRIDQMERSFARGAVACVGWPWDDALERKVTAKATPELATISEMMTAINRGAESPELEKIIKKDPSMAYRLLRSSTHPDSVWRPRSIRLAMRSCCWAPTSSSAGSVCCWPAATRIRTCGQFHLLRFAVRCCSSNWSPCPRGIRCATRSS